MDEPTQDTHPHENEKLVTIAEFEHDFEAEMVRIALEDADIPCTVVGGDLMANLPPIEPIKIELQVFERDAERAAAIVKDALSTKADEAIDDADDLGTED